MALPMSEKAGTLVAILADLLDATEESDARHWLQMPKIVLSVRRLIRERRLLSSHHLLRISHRSCDNDLSLDSLYAYVYIHIQCSVRISI